MSPHQTRGDGMGDSSGPAAATATCRVWLLFGVSGSGKSRIGNHLRKELDLTFIEGDDSLSEKDRERITKDGILKGWRHDRFVAKVIKATIDAATAGHTSIAVAFPALRLSDRLAWRDAIEHANAVSIALAAPSSTSQPQPIIHLNFLYFKISPRLAKTTVAARHDRDGHMVREAAVEVQFQVLEVPAGDERDCAELFCQETEALKKKAKRHVQLVSEGAEGCTCKLCV